MNLLITIQKRKLWILTVGFFLALFGWWLSILLRGLTEGRENDLFTSVYFIVALWGSIAGLIVAKHWGGYKSMFGRAVGAFSLGLFGQAIGQVIFNVYLIGFGVELPYPSIADIGFFSTGLLYGYGAIQLMKVTGVNFSLRNLRSKIIAIIIPVLWAAFSYWFFLRGFEYDGSNPLATILDLISPVIDAGYLSLAIFAFILSWKWLGGLMKWPVSLLLLAIIAQAVSDFHFLYQASRETWYAAGTNDLLFLITFVLMTLALIELGSTFDKINEV